MRTRQLSWKNGLPLPPLLGLTLLFLLIKCLCSSFSRMPDPDFTVRDVKLLVGKLLCVCVAQRC